ncbi:TPA: site-specific DNA-methyltransferase [Streptococcus suis]|nr:site-specific DNA-methyltransferase [Streptococcus suis]HEM3721908.1 site-specific DNA-methyltransferase [Streptococcus suis]
MKQELERLLTQNDTFMVEGVLNKNKLAELARQYNPELLNLLMSDEKISQHFFSTLETGVLVFKRDVFLQFLNNKEFLPDSFTAYKTKIGLATGDKYLSENQEVVLNFPYKDCVLEGGQTKDDAKRQEIFFNETLAPTEINRLLDDKVLTNFRRYDQEGEHEVEELSDTDNLIIKGNNLIALHSLKKRFAGKIDVIYIDPPFNTGGDSFKYNDSFNHSTWLTFMKNRLNIARELLSPTGNIFIHIDINESHYLKVLCDEIFKKENFVEEIIWSYGSASGGRAKGAKPVNIHDYILHYAKSYNNRKQYKVYTEYDEKYIKDWFKFDDGDGRIYRRRHRGVDENGEAIWEKQYLDSSKGVPLTTVWKDIPQIYANPQAYKESNRATSEIEFDFDNSGQKPEKLLKRILEMCSSDGDIILDFFMGTGTTLATALKTNRQFIGVEQMESQIEITKNRLNAAIRGKVSGISYELNWSGGGSFVYAELKNDAQDFKNAIFEVATTEELLELFKLAKKSSFLSYRIDPKKLKTNEFSQLSLAEQKQVLSELIDNNNLYVNYADMDDSDYGISDQDKKLNHAFYGKEK